MKKIFTFLILFNFIFSQKILIPMDATQKDHLKAYGFAFWILKQKDNVDWLLNYKGGSFLIDAKQIYNKESKLRGITSNYITNNELNIIYQDIENNNMSIILLEKLPKIAVYSPPDKQPWDDAVTLALTYAEVEYDVIFDEEILNGDLKKYDWLHLHHEDFTGQYGKFYKSFRNTSWYKKLENDFKKIASKHGFKSVPSLKKNIAFLIKQYLNSGGFLFAMCSATDSFDIALATLNVDTASEVFDGTPIDYNYEQKMNFENSIAFENYNLYPNPMIYEYSEIDYPPSHIPNARGAEADYFTLFEFSAKWDPVPTMLCQNHSRIIKGFIGQTTSFSKELIKPNVIIMGENKSLKEARYIHGKFGKGTWTFYGGHDPEDYKHKIGDPKTELELYPNSPGYRLILNNILFPAAKKKKQKT